ncbi:MAG: KEOPS complex subunit Pcc1 [Candidatus Woesearchaeota archaeon]|nr:KEOPS complex subunit Pcc1 [Candidatus Woesearchaeota archaeon]
MITADIVVDEPAADALYQAALPELMTTERAAITARAEKNRVIFTIKSQDATAFRAGMNTLIQILTVFEKMKKIK